MVITPLCSSSAANSTFIGEREGGILIDVGCSCKSLNNYLSLCEIELSAIKAVLITHEHADHVKGLFQFTKQAGKRGLDIPVFASEGTCGAILEKGLVYNADRLFTLDRLSQIGLDYEVRAFNTPHDSAQSVGFIIDSNGRKIAYITDLGEITAEIEDATLGAEFVFIESNYDSELLRNNNKYPQFTKDRIKSSRGHLSNDDSADYIVKLVENGATKIVLGHLSRENNTPRIAYSNTVERLKTAGININKDYRLRIAEVAVV
jgi:phosphoribosyl 1,2-cyclic phosphodiesterase